ncbi:MAG: tandem-95 repeat protein, partial [Cycloclasticus sp.]
DGRYRFDPSDPAYDHLKAGDSTVLSIPVTVTDEHGATDTSQIQITVTGTNNGPVANNDTNSTNFSPENATLTTEISFDEGSPRAAAGRITSQADGQVGNSADFDKAKLSVNDLELNSDSGAQTTISMWIQGDSDGRWEMLAGSDHYDLALVSGDIGFNTAGGDLFGSDASELNDGEWHHIVGVFTNGDVTQNSIYIDGSPQEMSQIRGRPNNSRANIDSDDGTLNFGGWGASNGYRFTGSMDEVKVYDGELTADDVSNLYAIETGGERWNAESLTTHEDSSLIITPTELLANDTDADDHSLSISSVQDAENGRVKIDDDGNIAFTPDENYNGEASFSYTITDDHGGTDTATVTLNIESINDAPVIDIINTITLDEDGSKNITYSISDADGDEVTVTAEASNGDVTVNDNGTVTFTPNENYNGSDTLIITATDSEGAVTTQEIAVTVNTMNDGPIANNDTSGTNFSPENATLTTEISFDEGTPRAAAGRITSQADGQVGNSADFDKAKLSVNDLELNSDSGAQTTISMWIQGDSDGRWEMLAGSDHYDLALVSGDIGFNTAGGDLFGSDASELNDGEWHHIVGVFTNGDVTQNSIYIDGSPQEMSQIRGRPNNSRANIDSDDGTLNFGGWGASNGYRFTGSMDEVKVYDGELTADDVSNLYAIETGGERWNAESLTTHEDSSLIITPTELLANDTDADDHSLSISSVQDAENGRVKIDDDGNIAFTPDENYNGEASFSYTITDDHGGTDTATVSLNVESVNDAVDISIINTSITEGTPQIIASANDIDGSIESSSLTAEHGTVAMDNDGNITYTADTDYDGTDNVSLSITDNDGATTTQTINLSIDPAQNTLVLVNEIRGTEQGETLSGTDGVDHIWGDAGNDSINAGDGNDTITAGSGRNSISAGDGDDTINISEGDGADNYEVVHGGDGTDTVVFEGNRTDYTVTHDDNNGRFTMTNIATGETNYIYDGVETIEFGDTSISTFTDGAPTITLINDGVVADENEHGKHSRGHDKHDHEHGHDKHGKGHDKHDHEHGHDKHGKGHDKHDHEHDKHGKGHDKHDHEHDKHSKGHDNHAHEHGHDKHGKGHDKHDHEHGHDKHGKGHDKHDHEHDKHGKGHDKHAHEHGHDKHGKGHDKHDHEHGHDKHGKGHDKHDHEHGDDKHSKGHSKTLLDDDKSNHLNEDNDSFIFEHHSSSDIFHAGEGWTNSVQLEATEDSDNPWEIAVDDAQREYDLAADALELQPDTSGVVTMADGSELSLDGVEEVKW